MFTHILVPLDCSENAARAIEPALSLAEIYGARITLLTVVFRAPLSHANEGAFLDQYVEQHGQQYLEDIYATRMRATSAPVGRVVRLGTAAEAIIECAVESYADLIVVSAHGAIGTRHSLGSTASRILREAAAAMLTGTGPDRQDRAEVETHADHPGGVLERGNRRLTHGNRPTAGPRR